MVLRRLRWVRMMQLLALCAAAAAGFTLWQRRAAPAELTTEPPTWPPLDPPPPMTPPTAEPSPSDPTGSGWASPMDGACPPGYPVKVKLTSGIYHVPGGLSYERTVPDRCYADPAAAEADGYRAAKR